MSNSLYADSKSGKLVVAALLLNFILFGFGLFTPVIMIKQLGLFTDTFSVYLGIYVLFTEHQIFLGLVVLLFSIVFPFAKLVVLSTIWLLPISNPDRKKLLKGLEVLGKWSMMDVFVIAMTVVVAKLSGFANAEALYGIYIFAAAVVMSMLLTVYVDKCVRK